jgi:hypothetical protein
VKAPAFAVKLNPVKTFPVAALSVKEGCGIVIV